MGGASIVHLSTEKVVPLDGQPFWEESGKSYDLLLQEFHRQWVTQPVKYKPLGSGVIIDTKGIILTNAHVAQMGSPLHVTFRDGSRAEGQVIFVSPKDNMALIKVKPPYVLKAVNLAWSDDLMAGETVVAVASPLGPENAVSLGVVSGTHRSFSLSPQGSVFTDLIQTDLTLTLGYSGGALFNLDGELVGMNLAVTGQAPGIGFAVSHVKIKEVMDQFYLVNRFAEERENAIEQALPVKRR